LEVDFLRSLQRNPPFFLCAFFWTPVPVASVPPPCAPPALAPPPLAMFRFPCTFLSPLPTPTATRIHLVFGSSFQEHPPLHWVNCALEAPPCVTFPPRWPSCFIFFLTFLSFWSLFWSGPSPVHHPFFPPGGVPPPPLLVPHSHPYFAPPSVTKVYPFPLLLSPALVDTSISPPKIVCDSPLFLSLNFFTCHPKAPVHAGQAPCTHQRPGSTPSFFLGPRDVFLSPQSPPLFFRTLSTFFFRSFPPSYTVTKDFPDFELTFGPPHWACLLNLLCTPYTHRLDLSPCGQGPGLSVPILYFSSGI